MSSAELRSASSFPNRKRICCTPYWKTRYFAINVLLMRRAEKNNNSIKMRLIGFSRRTIIGCSHLSLSAKFVESIRTFYEWACGGGENKTDSAVLLVKPWGNGRRATPNHATIGAAIKTHGANLAAAFEVRSSPRSDGTSYGQAIYVG